jgi:pSer/pThr/pTyr-binding forkhead associated (FHA) protein
MPKLFVNPSSSAAWEIHLKAGVNRLGRGATNDFLLTEPSVSGCHCEILVTGQLVVIRDLGSTNGTFVNRTLVREAALREGDRIHLGAVELIYAAETAAVPARARAEAAPARPAPPSAKVLVARVVPGPASGAPGAAQPAAVITARAPQPLSP